MIRKITGLKFYKKTNYKKAIPANLTLVKSFKERYSIEESQRKMGFNSI